jgi:cytochrome c oxidase subunit 2
VSPLGLGLPENASAHGHLIDELLWATDRFDVVVVALLLGVLVLACVRFGRSRTASADRGDSRWAVAKVLGLSLLLFGVVDGYLLGASLRGVDQVFWNFAAVEADPRTLRVELNAQQWSWAVRYAGPDGAFNTADDVLALDEVRVPVGRPVLFSLAATDVVHGFSLPSFRVKQDVVPGRLTRLWIQAARPGTFEIVCQQFCGVSHYKMRGELVAMPAAEFDLWLQEASRQARKAFDPDDAGAHWGWAWRAAR